MTYTFFSNVRIKGVMKSLPDGQLDLTTRVYTNDAPRAAFFPQNKAYGIREHLIQGLAEKGCNLIRIQGHLTTWESPVVFAMELPFTEFLAKAVKTSIGEEGFRYYVPVAGPNAGWTILSGKVPSDYFQRPIDYGKR